MFARLAPLKRRSARGSATLEYAAAFALVAILVGGTVISARASAPSYGEIVRDAICKVATAVGMGESCAGGTDPNTAGQVALAGVDRADSDSEGSLTVTTTSLTSAPPNSVRW